MLRVRSCKARQVPPLKRPLRVGLGGKDKKRKCTRARRDTSACAEETSMMSTPHACPGHGTCHVSSDCASCSMEGERCECGGLFFLPAVVKARGAASAH